MNNDSHLPRFFIEGKKLGKSDEELRNVISEFIIRESEDYRENLDLITEFYFTYYNRIYEKI